MHKNFWSIALLAAAGCAHAGTPPADDTDAKLRAAQQRLEQAAKEVALLSMKDLEPIMERFKASGERGDRAAAGAFLGPELRGRMMAAMGQAFGGGIAGMELATLTPKLGRYFGATRGILVVRAPEDAGFKLEDGDVIVGIDGRTPQDGAHALRILGSYQTGETARLEILRDRKPLTLDVVMPERRAPHLAVLDADD